MQLTKISIIIELTQKPIFQRDMYAVKDMYAIKYDNLI